MYDVAVIGAGIVGCAVARKFTLEGARVVVLEKSADLLAGASKSNSGVMHTGFDAPEGSLEWSCMREGHAEFRKIKDRLGLPILDYGAVVVAFNEEELQKLESIREKAIRNGVEGVSVLSRSELLLREPNLSSDALGAVFVPGECVVDPWSMPLAYLQQALANGAAVRFCAEVRSGEYSVGSWRLNLTSGTVFAKTVINCAGNYGDIVDRRLLGVAQFEIRPRRGQFVVFDKPASHLINSIILPIPTERTKGVLLTRTVFGNLLVGPTAEDQESREAARPNANTAADLISQAVAILPSLKTVSAISTYVGLRPATEEPGYRIFAQPERAWITVGGIRSTGLTAALGIANYVFGLYASALPLPPVPRGNIVWPYMPQLAENAVRDWQKPGLHEIVCECEKVTVREIQAALHSSLPARDLGGLKRRTRAAMGSCQGERCLPRVAEFLGVQVEQFNKVREQSCAKCVIQKGVADDSADCA